MNLNKLKLELFHTRNLTISSLAFSLFAIFLTVFSSNTFSETPNPLETTLSSWKLQGEMISIVRDPIEHVSINESCHPVSEKDCDVNKALKKYQDMEATEELKLIFSENQDTAPGVIVCHQLVNGKVILGELPRRGRFPKYAEFCQFEDKSLITVSSLAFYTGPEKLPEMPPSTKND